MKYGQADSMQPRYSQKIQQDSPVDKYNSSDDEDKYGQESESEVEQIVFLTIKNQQ